MRGAGTLGFWQTVGYLTSLGWLMAVPIAGGILLGNYLDSRSGGGHTWALALLGAGIGIATLEVYLALQRALRSMGR